jgi:hypothetical protein
MVRLKSRCHSKMRAAVHVHTSDIPLNSTCLLSSSSFSFSFSFLFLFLFLPARTGLGALVSPLIATQFSVFPIRWRLHYISSLGLAGLSFALILFAFRGKAEKDLLPQPPPSRSPILQAPEDQSQIASQGKGELGVEVGDRERSIEANTETWSKMNRIMRNRAVHALAMWAFMYTGTEVSLGG